MASELKILSKMFSTRNKMDKLLPSDHGLRQRPLKQLWVITKVTEQINPSDYVSEQINPSDYIQQM